MPTERPVKFYGLSDLATPYQAREAAAALESFDYQKADHSLAEIIELHNAKLFIEAGVFPGASSSDERVSLQAIIPATRRAIGTFFSQLNDSKLATLSGTLDYDYHSDLLDLFARNKVYSHCTSEVVLALLDRLDLNLQTMLANRDLVVFCNEQLRLRLLADVANAELVIRKHLEQGQQQNIHLPASLTSADAAGLINGYLDSDDPHLNYLKLVLLAHPKPEIGLDTRMKLKAKRRYDRSAREFFSSNTGMRVSCEVSLSPEQEEPIVSSADGADTKYSYSQQWLEDNLDFPTILNNFIFLFEFVDTRAMLLLPSFEHEIGAVEGLLGASATGSYKTGVVFRSKDQLSSMQVQLYLHFLRDRGIELEAVIAWFFSTQVVTEFGVEGLILTPSSPTATYLERCRHLFSEMESVVKQYRLYVEDGRIDSELLSISSEQVSYGSLPSLLHGKYLYSSDHQDIETILHLLFSDQAGLGYINEELKAESAAALLARNEVSYDNFRAYQQARLDYLIDRGILTNTSESLGFADYDQLFVLKEIYDHGAASYYHYSAEARVVIDEMIRTGWLTQKDTLLSDMEANYLNYMLNQQFSNGLDLRNRYLHGSQANTSGEDAHFETYIIILKLLVALIIKINDDLCLRTEEDS